MSKKPHILAVPFPAQGHMSPMLHLCKTIAAQGFTVSFLNVDSIHEQMQKHWVHTPGLDIRLEPLPFEWVIPSGFDAYCMGNLVAFFEAMPTVGAALGDLIEKSNEEEAPVLAIISDHFLPWTEQVANKYGIPRIALWTASATCLSIEFHSPELVARGQVPPRDATKDELIDWIPGLSPLRQADIPTYMHLDDKRWLEITMGRSPALKEASWVLVNSFYDLEADTFDAMRRALGQKFVPIGPIFLQEYCHSEVGRENVVLRSEDEECIRWLDGQKPLSVLYISFGSIAVLSFEQFEQLAQALESSKQPFLWVIRSDLVVGGDDEGAYQEVCERTKNQGCIVSWAPQIRVLEHPSVGGFLTHCGWNSMLESMSNGVPMLCWPWAAEQNLNCKLMAEDWKIGAGFSKGANGFIEKAEIERVVNLLMSEAEGDEMRKRLGEIKKAARKAVQEGGPSLNNLLAFLAEVRSLA